MYVFIINLVRILTIMSSLCLMFFNAYYAQNYAGVIGTSLTITHIHTYIHRYIHTYMVSFADLN